MYMAKRLQCYPTRRFKYYVMKKILIASFVALNVAACSNPEDSVNNNTDSARNANTEDSTLNTQPGPTTPDTSGGRGQIRQWFRQDRVTKLLAPQEARQAKINKGV